MQVMRWWRQKVTRTVISAHPCIFYGGPEEDTGHMRIMCARDKAVAPLLCAEVEEFTADLPVADRTMEFMSWKEHSYRWTESLMTGVVPGDLKRLFATMRAASSRGPAKAKLFLEDMLQIGEDVYTRRNHRLTEIMQLPMLDRTKAVYAFLRGDTPFCPPVGRVRQLPPWNLYDGLLGNLQANLQRAPLHALLVSGSCVTDDEAMSTCPSGWRLRRKPFANGSSPRWPMIIPHSRSGPARCLHSPGPQFVVPWYAIRTVKANSGFRCLQTIRLLETPWVGPVKCCRSSNNHCAPSQSWRWPPCWTWECCGCMTGSCRGSFRWQRNKGPWPF